MNTKKQLTSIILITCLLVSGIVYADETVKSGTASNTTSGNHDGMNWQEQTMRTSVLITDGVRITTGPSIGTTGLLWSIGFSSNITVIECCRPCSIKQSWCNFNADDERCRN